jgi:hypothetical protein
MYQVFLLMKWETSQNDQARYNLGFANEMTLKLAA